MTYFSAGHIILTPTQPVGSGRPQRESNPGPPHQESRALPAELPPPPPPPPPCLTQQNMHMIFAAHIDRFSTLNFQDKLCNSLVARDRKGHARSRQWACTFVNFSKSGISCRDKSRCVLITRSTLRTTKN